MKLAIQKGLVVSLALLFMSAYALADGVSISLQTAYCFNGHAAPCDGGLAQVTNNGGDGITINSIVASGWLSGHTDNITAEGGSGGQTSIGSGGSLIFNSFLTSSGDDTSNDGAVADLSKGIVFTIQVTDTVDHSTGTFIFYDNAASHYSFIDGSGVATTGADCDASGCGGSNFTSNSTAPITGNPASSPVPEPGSMALLSTGLVGIAGVVRRKIKL